MKEKKQASFFLAILPIVSMILLIGIGVGYYKLSVPMLMLLSSVVPAAIALYLGYSWDEIMDSIVSKLSKTMPAIFILIVVGLMIGSWMIGGTIPMLVYYGLKIISPSFMVITAFLVTAIVSLCTGTSWGSAGTVGVALIGVASAMGTPLPIVAGAIVAGAYFGDKLSPLSDTTNLAALASGVNIYDHIGHMLYTTVPGFIISCIVYTIVGLNIDVANFSTPEKVTTILTTLDTIFTFNPLILVPPIIVFVGSIRKKPSIPVMMIASAMAMINAFVIQNFTIKSIFDAAVKGFNVEMVTVAAFDPSSVIWDVTRLLNRGGMNSMLGVVLLSMCAYAFAGAMSVTNSLDIVINKLLKRVKNTGGLVGATIVACMTCVFVTSNGQLSILLPGEIFRKVYIKRGLHPKNLSRTLEDGATVIGAITPWNAAGVYMATTLGVATLSYLPWAILNYTAFMFALLWAYTGLFITKIKPGDDCYEEYLQLQKEDENIKEESNIITADLRM